MGLMLGMCYEQKEMVLEVDEIALFYSDGLVEAHYPYGEIFDFPRLTDARRGARRGGLAQ